MADAGLADTGAYDNYEYAADPTVLPSVGIQPPDPGINWQGLGDFISEVTPTAAGVVALASGKPNVSVSSAPGQFSASTTSPSAGLFAGSGGALSPLTLLLVLGGAALLIHAVLK